MREPAHGREEERNEPDLEGRVDTRDIERGHPGVDKNNPSAAAMKVTNKRLTDDTCLVMSSSSPIGGKRSNDKAVPQVERGGPVNVQL